MYEINIFLLYVFLFSRYCYPPFSPDNVFVSHFHGFLWLKLKVILCFPDHLKAVLLLNAFRASLH